MMAIVRMPEVATGASEAAIQAWLVDAGAAVTVGQPLVEIETEKAVVELEAEEDGVLAALLLPSGAAAAVGTPIAVIASRGQSPEDALKDAGVSPQSDSAEDPPSAVVHEPSTDQAPVPAEDAPPAGAAIAHERPKPERVFASPLVRRLAKERGLDLSQIIGSGPNGRVVRRDLDAAAEPAPAPTADTKEAPGAGKPTPGEETYVDIRHSGMRRAIARRLTESKSSVPHFYVKADCRVDDLLALRRRINETSAVKISLNDLVVKATACALTDVSAANAIWMPDAVRRFESVDIAVAVSVDQGLLTPVVRSVDRLSLSELSRSIRDLADRAKEGRLKQHELEGGSFSVSNLGMYGTAEFSAIINPPHAGILAVGAATKRPVVEEDGSVGVASIMTVTLSADHRVLDGAVAAQWLNAFVTRLENPLSILI